MRFLRVTLVLSSRGLLGCEGGCRVPIESEVGSGATGRSASRDGGVTAGGTATGGGSPFPQNDAGVLQCKPLSTPCGTASECCSLTCASGVCGGPVTGGACDPARAPCTAASACCTARCEPLPSSNQRACQNACFGDGAPCARALECCSYACNGGRCGGALCKVSNEDCTADVECCGNRCVGGRCTVNTNNCRPTAETCTSDGSTTCCATCDTSVQPRPRCAFAADTCRGTGATCTPDGGAGNCCRGLCQGGTCVTPCVNPGATCTAPCCAGSCLGGSCSVITIDAGVASNPDGGVCRIIGQRCATGGDCCSTVCFGGFCEPQLM